MAPLEIRHRSVRPISAKHAQASRFLQQSPMGYEDSDYCARKSRQHTGMKQIGVLHTDPPKWLDNDHPPFEKHMYGVFMHLRY
ncbi:hypothetical protein RRL66_005851 [Escherichia coli]|nr:hypothetical protein [Escherichia coli]ELI6104285.1 hypothetical protein [Escherichia coli]